nr:hypothetical protein [uncultured Amphritea sp.]
MSDFNAGLWLLSISKVLFSYSSNDGLLLICLATIQLLFELNQQRKMTLSQTLDHSMFKRPLEKGKPSRGLT